jgi:CubicO group peptidase (beta-lactamase class C family)
LRFSVSIRKKFMNLRLLGIRSAQIACIIGVTTGTALARGQELTDARLAPAFQLVEQAVARQEIPGALLLVAQHGKIVREETYGLSDVEHNIPFRTNTICWLASITKPVTVTAAMILVDQGKLALDAPIEKYLPEFKDQKAPDGRHYAATIRQLMSHNSGIPRNPPFRPKLFFEPVWLGRNLADVVHELASSQLEFVPGQKFQYSNGALYVLARIIEIQSGKSYRKFVEANVLQPLGMNETFFSIPAADAERIAVVYRNDKGQRTTFCRYDPGWKISMTMPDGGLFSTAGDVAKFTQMFLDNDGAILSRASANEMLTKQASGWGLGWELQPDGVFGHDGSSGTRVWADPKTGVVGILFTQMQDTARVDPLQNHVREAIRSAAANLNETK